MNDKIMILHYKDIKYDKYSTCCLSLYKDISIYDIYLRVNNKNHFKGCFLCLIKNIYTLIIISYYFSTIIFFISNCVIFA